ncbi:MAG: type III-B CRISPR module RAMP protein Cmr1 [Defluviitaleaceae bacterium]|nr:type III-B CRISPR module RAMP protein Cmr1 [Defluviitaleaceae bacterium]
MESKNVKYKVITPIFSYGISAKHPEIRASSIKGMMRYMFRIAQPILDTKDLLELENAIFGNAESIASPVRLSVLSSKINTSSCEFLLHDNKKNGKNNSKNCIFPNENFSLLVRTRKNSLKELNWYIDLIELSFLLIGLGQRSRKGRGRIMILNENQPTSCEVKNSILSKLNNIYKEQNNENSKEFYKCDNMIVSKNVSSNVKRPVIKKILFGDIEKNSWKSFLKSVDTASHEIKSELKPHRIDGKAYYATGSALSNNKFASSIIVGLAHTKEGYLPIYTCVKAVANKEVLDKQKTKKEWETFVDKVERKGVSN